MIAQELHAIQHQHGFLPEKELRALAARTGTRLHRLQEVASFFPHFRLEPPAPIQVRICQDMSCELRGACDLTKTLNKAAQKYSASESAPTIEVNSVSCLGRCDRAPAAYVSTAIPTAGSGDVATAQEHTNYYASVDQPKLSSIISKSIAAIKKHDASRLVPTDHDVAWQPGQVNAWSIDVYRGKQDEDCYAGIRNFVTRRGQTLPSLPWQVDDETKAAVAGALRGDLNDLDAETQRILCSLFNANLLGMGGAGGRTYKKWFEVLRAVGDTKYVVCNGDESEPGTFKDRELLLRSPHLVVEGVGLAGLLLGATRGYIYIRHEYEEQIAAVRAEIERAERLGVCGTNVLGSGLDFPIEVFVSPGGYICGEQTALIEAMEDKRAEPRNRPPELQTNGLWNCPTLLNNVETLAWVPAIVGTDNGRGFASQGKQDYRGRRFFSVSGDVANPGAYEVPVGLTLRELIEDYCGGMAVGQSFKAIAMSGPSGGFTPRYLPVEYMPERFVTSNLTEGQTEFDILEMELDIQTSRNMGVMLGAGMAVFGEQADMVQQAVICSEFYRNESCGKCVPCRIGSQKLVELVTDISARKYTLAEIYGGPASDGKSKQGLVNELSETMALTAICGLGTVASNPLTTLLIHFRSDVERYAKKVND